MTKLATMTKSICALIVGIFIAACLTAAPLSINIPGLGVREVLDIGQTGVKAFVQAGQCADGSLPLPGRTCAAGIGYNLGTQLYIVGVGVRTVTDRYYTTLYDQNNYKLSIFVHVANSNAVAAFGIPIARQVYIIK